MRRLLTACVILLAGITLAGWIHGDGRDRMTLKAVTSKRLVTVVVYLPDITDRYRWLSVYGCSAEMQETGTFCTGYWERESTQELFGGYKQYLFDWRDLPPGTTKVTAMAFDINHAVLASDTLTILRGE